MGCEQSQPEISYKSCLKTNPYSTSNLRAIAKINLARDRGCINIQNRLDNLTVNQIYLENSQEPSHAVKKRGQCNICQEVTVNCWHLPCQHQSCHHCLFIGNSDNKCRVCLQQFELVAP